MGDRSDVVTVDEPLVAGDFEPPPPPSVREVLYRVSLGQPLAADSVRRAMLDLFTVPVRTSRDTLLAALLSGLMARGPSEDEVVEALTAALSLDGDGTTHLPPPPGSRLLLLAGSGKKGIKSFNISTSSALVAAAAGASVVKIGSRATSSVMGSRDLVESLGLPQSRTDEEIREAVGRTGMAFVPVEDRIPVFDSVYGGRFHVLNPLSFGLAALAPRLRGGVLVYGLAHPAVDLSARVLRRFGVREALVVASGNADGYFGDEFGLGEQSLSCRVTRGEVGEVEVAGPRDLASRGLPAPGHPVRAPRSSAEAVRWVLDALAGEGSSEHRHLIALNSALLLTTAGVARDLSDGYQLALDVLRSGRAWAKVEELRKESLCRQTV
ncbi:hypothetical protein ACH4F6_21685 [Streptomyces sp. NPDC017936]|uniref:hypothetical protein n=1 Tax=Streptomyces sp. NPDC017936 TaxID=3365016 RepID=UPI0037BDEB2E